jgi:hypothetical protein
MDFRLIERGRLDIPAWENLARHGSFFHTVDWADACVNGEDKDARSVFICGYEGRQIIAGMPAVMTCRFGLKSFYSMPDGTYGGPIFSDACDEKSHYGFFEYLNRYFHDNKFSKIVVVDFDGVSAGWEVPMNRRRYFTHEVFLDDPENYRPDKKIEQHLRVGQKADSEIIEISRPSHVDDFYRLYLLTARRHGQKRPRHEIKFFENLYNQMGDSPKLYWTALVVGQSMAGSQINFFHQDTLINWQTVSDYEMRRYKPNQMLLYDAICKAGADGLKKVNLGASPPEASGLIGYKERWRGRKKEYEIITGTSWYRKLLGR